MSKYQKLAENIRQQIRSGQLQPGDRLPSINKLREQYGISYGTVRSAMIILKSEKLITGSPGEGVFVSRTGIDDMAAAQRTEMTRDPQLA